MNLREAAQQALEALECYEGINQGVKEAADDLRDALAEDVPETNFGNMAQAVYSKEAETTSQEPQQVEPVAWMVYTMDGKSAFITDNPADFTPKHRALPLYTTPPKRDPLTDEEIDYWIGSNSTKKALCRAIERAHDIGGEE